ncbi:unnamed protein product [Adineta steineri]|uniref:NADH dehydrogenase [ubiquinone] 1 alpha subcomplex subunit 7 n=2 Tax=Adineta steineri TaxID=433720 RepID=A0A814HWM6_9BILA|nr:unnamed protein product [Adineta steineri]CAF0870192.1 unnamed protein product [Adineta steineri]CAF1015595.1 unnamed protein product [Adineta steineri]
MSSKVKDVAKAAAPVVKRDINKWLFPIRQFLMLRKFTHNQRHEFEWAKRTQPPPLIPGGFAHKLSKNYYYDRDARRQVGQPQVVFSNNNQFLASATQPQITAGASAQAPSQQAAATTSTATNTSTFLSILEAEKQTASLLTTQSKTPIQSRTPGKVYNWDG